MKTNPAADAHTVYLWTHCPEPPCLCYKGITQPTWAHSSSWIHPNGFYPPAEPPPSCRQVQPFPINSQHRFCLHAPTVLLVKATFTQKGVKNNIRDQEFPLETCFSSLLSQSHQERWVSYTSHSTSSHSHISTLILQIQARSSNFFFAANGCTSETKWLLPFSREAL